MIALQLALTAVLVSFCWAPAFLPTALIWAALASIWAFVSRQPGPAWVAPPTRAPKERRWGLGLGLGLTPVGPLPFVTIYRRPKMQKPLDAGSTAE